jgi:hypothetical protein
LVTGIFSYEEDGFVIQNQKGTKKYLYAGIEAIIAYKVDRVTYDEIRLEVIFDECALGIFRHSSFSQRLCACEEAFFREFGFDFFDGLQQVVFRICQFRDRCGHGLPGGLHPADELLAFFGEE